MRPRRLARASIAWALARRLARRLRRPPAPPGPPPPPRAPRRPRVDPALRRRLGRWRLRGGRAGSLGAAEAARAMAHLERLRADMAEGPRALLDARLAEGRVTPRRLGPDDGWVWEMPGMRVFAIAGVRAFTVPDEEPPAGGG